MGKDGVACRGPDGVTVGTGSRSEILLLLRARASQSWLCSADDMCGEWDFIDIKPMTLFVRGGLLCVDMFFHGPP